MGGRGQGPPRERASEGAERSEGAMPTRWRFRRRKVYLRRVRRPLGDVIEKQKAPEDHRGPIRRALIANRYQRYSSQTKRMPTLATRCQRG